MRNTKEMIKVKPVIREEILENREVKRRQRFLKNYKIKISINDQKLVHTKALKVKIEKAKEKREERDAYRKKIAKIQGVNWKRVRIVDWKLKTTIIK